MNGSAVDDGCRFTSGWVIVVTTDGMLKNLLSFFVEKLDSGALGWVLGGEMVLLTADGGWDD